MLSGLKAATANMKAATANITRSFAKKLLQAAGPDPDLPSSSSASDAVLLVPAEDKASEPADDADDGIFGSVI